MRFVEHDAFLREAKKLAKKYPIEASLRTAKFLLPQYFTASDKDPIISKDKIHRVSVKPGVELWKFEVFVKGLRPNQWPRMWLVVSGDTIYLLALKTHTQDYDNNETDRIALARYKELANM